MGLTKAQATIWQKARSLGNGEQAVGLSNDCCAYLVGRIAHDLQLTETFPEFAGSLPEFFSDGPLDQLQVEGFDAKALFERLVTIQQDTDTYFACLAAMHKARLKYERILSTQPLPTLEQVGPRGLLQFGKLRSDALAGFLFWRKWFYDIDNRAAQETGYLFEPIIAHAIGGTPAPAKKSPVKRQSDRSKGRQVDCILDDRAYEFKIRVTIAASGQGRWQEELDFPTDCRTSGFTPVLVCLDSTPNPKLSALVDAFAAQGGEVFIGEAAWEHLRSVAGPTMGLFLQRYVREPLQSLLAEAPEVPPSLVANWSHDKIDIRVGGAGFAIERRETTVDDSSEELPDDVADEAADL